MLLRPARCRRLHQGQHGHRSVSGNPDGRGDASDEWAAGEGPEGARKSIVDDWRYFAEGGCFVDSARLRGRPTEKPAAGEIVGDELFTQLPGQHLVVGCS